jgi:hypothetical protein
LVSTTHPAIVGRPVGEGLSVLVLVTSFLLAVESSTVSLWVDYGP